MSGYTAAVKSIQSRGFGSASPGGSAMRLRCGLACGPKRTKAPDRVVWGFGEGWLRGQDGLAPCGTCNYLKYFNACQRKATGTPFNTPFTDHSRQVGYKVRRTALQIWSVPRIGQAQRGRAVKGLGFAIGPGLNQKQICPCGVPPLRTKADLPLSPNCGRSLIAAN